MIFTEGSQKKCSSCKKKFSRIDVWKQENGKYLCRQCLKAQHQPQEKRSDLHDFRKRPDYVEDDFDENDSSRISDLEFESIIEEFEQGSWSGTRSHAEYQKHEAYINLLFQLEFQRRKGIRKERKPETTKSKSQVTYYEILLVKQNASFAEIQESYRKLVIQWHPDRNKEDLVLAESMFKKIREAYETLKDPEKRKKYDLSIA